MDEVSKNRINTEKLLDELKLEQPKIDAQENKFDNLNCQGNVYEESYGKKGDPYNCKSLEMHDKNKVIVGENTDCFKMNISDNYNNMIDHVDLNINSDIDKLLKNYDEKVTTNGKNTKIIYDKEKGEDKTIKISEKKILNACKNNDASFVYDKVNENGIQLYGNGGDDNGKMNLNFIRNFEEEKKLKSKLPSNDINSVNINLKSDEKGVNKEVKSNNNNDLIKNNVNENHNELHDVRITKNINKSFEKTDIYRKSSLIGYSFSGVKLLKIKNKELSKDKKIKNKNRSKELLT